MPTQLTFDEQEERRGFTLGTMRVELAEDIEPWRGMVAVRVLEEGVYKNTRIGEGCIVWVEKERCE